MSTRCSSRAKHSQTRASRTLIILVHDHPPGPRRPNGTPASPRLARRRRDRQPEETLGFDRRPSRSGRDVIALRPVCSRSGPSPPRSEWDVDWAWRKECRTAQPPRPAGGKRNYRPAWTRRRSDVPADAKGLATRRVRQGPDGARRCRARVVGRLGRPRRSNNTMDGQPSFIPRTNQTREWSGGPWTHAPLRRHPRVRDGPDPQRHRPQQPDPPVWRHLPRLLGLHARRRAPGSHQETGVTFVWTHDSIGLGEDGPTHQPISTSPRCGIPDFDVVGPADASRTAAAWIAVLRNDRPAGLPCLSSRHCRRRTPLGRKMRQRRQGRVHPCGEASSGSRT